VVGKIVLQTIAIFWVGAIVDCNRLVPVGAIVDCNSDAHGRAIDYCDYCSTIAILTRTMTSFSHSSRITLDFFLLESSTGME
jgi:hypothetical protein